MKILIVDDDQELRDILGEILSEEGYPVRLAASGREAKAFLSSDPEIALVISDYTMPSGDGKDLLEFVRREHPSVRFFMITGQASLSKNEILQLGAQECIFKPFEIEEFLRKVRDTSQAEPQ